MSKVYTHTSRNLAWLGEEDSNTGPALAACEALLDEIREDTNNFQLMNEVVFVEFGTWKLADSGFRAQIDLHSIGLLLTLPWFSRR